MTSKANGSSDETKEPPPTDATRAYMDAAIQMHQDMAVPYANDADADFALVMAAHQRGAVALAQIELRYGTSERMKRLAETIIADNDKMIAALTAGNPGKK